MHDNHDTTGATQRDITTRQAAKQLDVSLRTLQRMLAAGAFPNAYKRRNRWYIPLNDLDTTGATMRHDSDDRRDIRDTDDTPLATSATPHQDTTPPPPDTPVSSDNPVSTESRNNPVTDNTPRPSTPAPAEPQQLAPDYRYRLQVDWPRLGVRFEYRKMMDERLIRDALQWVGRKWAEWREKAKG